MNVTQSTGSPDSAHLIDLLEARRLAATGEAHAIRAASGLSLRDIASAIGCTAPTVHRWERGTSTPYGSAALRYGALLAALRDHLKANDLAGGEVVGGVEVREQADGETA